MRMTVNRKKMGLKIKQNEAGQENLYCQMLFGQDVLLFQLHFLISKLSGLILLFLLYYMPHQSPELL